MTTAPRFTLFKLGYEVGALRLGLQSRSIQQANALCSVTRPARRISHHSTLSLARMTVEIR
jgi:hypothetical protein